MTKREIIQNEAKEKIIQEDYKGILLSSPRFGKSLVLIDSIRSKSTWNIVISSPYDTIKDSWSNEIVKWELGFNPTLICSRSLKKINSNIDLLVVDEIQMLSDNEIDIIISKSPKRILGLTGTLDIEKELNLNYRLGIKPIFTYTIEQAIEDNIIANFEIEVILCNFDNIDNTIQSGTKAKSKLTTEQGHYQFLHNQFEKFKHLCYTDYSRYKFMKDYYARKRKEFIYESRTKLGIAKEIINKLTRVIIFTGFIEQAEELSEYSFHTKNKKDNNLLKFQEGEIDKLGLVGMGGVGISIFNLKHAVIHQLQSSSEMSIQKILRVCNLEDDRDAKIYITCYDTSVDKDWLIKALKGINDDRIKWTKYEDFILDDE